MPLWPPFQASDPTKKKGAMAHLINTYSKKQLAFNKDLLNKENNALERAL